MEGNEEPAGEAEMVGRRRQTWHLGSEVLREYVTTTVSHSHLPGTLQRSWHYELQLNSQLGDREAQRGEVICPKPHSYGAIKR